MRAKLPTKNFKKDFNPLDSVYFNRAFKDGKSEEAKAIELEREKMRERLFRKPPNCS